MRSAHFSKFTSSIAHLAPNLLTAVGHFSSDGPPRIVQRVKSMPFQPQFYTKLISNNLLQTFSPEGDSLFSVFHKISPLKKSVVNDGRGWYNCDVGR